MRPWKHNLTTAQWLAAKCRPNLWPVKTARGKHYAAKHKSVGAPWS
jgi:hypothetical protein